METQSSNISQELGGKVECHARWNDLPVNIQNAVVAAIRQIEKIDPNSQIKLAIRPDGAWPDCLAGSTRAATYETWSGPTEIHMKGADGIKYDLSFLPPTDQGGYHIARHSLGDFGTFFWPGKDACPVEGLPWTLQYPDRGKEPGSLA